MMWKNICFIFIVDGSKQKYKKNFPMNLKYIFGIIVIEISRIYGIYHKKVAGVWGGN